jgi:hypothetical protein
MTLWHVFDTESLEIRWTLWRRPKAQEGHLLVCFEDFFRVWLQKQVFLWIAANPAQYKSWANDGLGSRVCLPTSSPFMMWA